MYTIQIILHKNRAFPTELLYNDDILNNRQLYLISLFIRNEYHKLKNYIIHRYVYGTRAKVNKNLIPIMYYYNKTLNKISNIQKNKIQIILHKNRAFATELLYNDNILNNRQLYLLSLFIRNKCNNLKNYIIHRYGTRAKVNKTLIPIMYQKYALLVSLRQTTTKISCIKQ